MIFASRVQKTIPIPSDPSNSVTIQKLPRRHFIAAEKAIVSEHTDMMAGFRQKLGDDWRDQFQRLRGTEETKKVVFDPLLRFDVTVLLQHGVKAWTYTDPPEPTPEALDDLDKETAEYLAREVLRLSAPKLFEAEEGEDSKNVSAPSGTA